MAIEIFPLVGYTFRTIGSFFKGLMPKASYILGFKIS